MTRIVNFPSNGPPFTPRSSTKYVAKSASRPGLISQDRLSHPYFLPFLSPTLTSTCHSGLFPTIHQPPWTGHQIPSGFLQALASLSNSDPSGTLAGKFLTKSWNALMKLLELVPEMDSDVELETAFLCSAVLEAAAGLALLAECGTSL